MRLSAADYELAKALLERHWWLKSDNPAYKAMQIAVRAMLVDGMTRAQVEAVGVFRRGEIRDIVTVADLLHRELFGHDDLGEGIRHYRTIGKRPWHRMAPLYRLQDQSESERA